jgi:hypothetical protein
MMIAIRVQILASRLNDDGTTSELLYILLRPHLFVHQSAFNIYSLYISKSNKLKKKHIISRLCP